MTKHLVEEFTLNIMIEHAATSAHAVPLIRSAYELPLAPARAIDIFLACPKGNLRPYKRWNWRLMPYICKLEEA
jgi:hypothetical protein